MIGIRYGLMVLVRGNLVTKEMKVMMNLRKRNYPIFLVSKKSTKVVVVGYALMSKKINSFLQAKLEGESFTDGCVVTYDESFHEYYQTDNGFRRRTQY
ncbi:hypothetical protein L1987_45337 [Smallanthus sonchifolius]|uniref:Uncharacterized protein n=1 Tax=Smallanthus sonchifolius TaxID=185202 RepID=A0ACB9GRP6_9ASTR|nr:hypothetical protein L1987_45337 [Smallanthus sonchifolius]